MKCGISPLESARARRRRSVDGSKRGPVDRGAGPGPLPALPRARALVGPALRRVPGGPAVVAGGWMPALRVARSLCGRPVPRGARGVLGGLGAARLRRAGAHVGLGAEGAGDGSLGPLACGDHGGAGAVGLVGRRVAGRAGTVGSPPAPSSWDGPRGPVGDGGRRSARPSGRCGPGAPASERADGGPAPFESTRAEPTAASEADCPRPWHGAADRRRAHHGIDPSRCGSRVARRRRDARAGSDGVSRGVTRGRRKARCRRAICAQGPPSGRVYQVHHKFVVRVLAFRRWPVLRSR